MQREQPMSQVGQTSPRHIIAILRGIKPAEVAPVCTALVEAGIGMIEITLNSPDPLTSIIEAAQLFGDRVLIGAGTVLSINDVDNVADAGARFVVSPDTNPAVIEHTRARAMFSYPGVLTPTEAFCAIRSGATGLKFFPGELIGPVGVRAMRAVLPPQMPVYAVGGATPDNFAEYFTAGCTGFGLGSFLYKSGRGADEVSKRARQAVKAYDKHMQSKIPN